MLLCKKCIKWKIFFYSVQFINHNLSDCQRIFWSHLSARVVWYTRRHARCAARRVNRLSTHAEVPFRPEFEWVEVCVAIVMRRPWFGVITMKSKRWKEKSFALPLSLVLFHLLSFFVTFLCFGKQFLRLTQSVMPRHWSAAWPLRRFPSVWYTITVDGFWAYSTIHPGSRRCGRTNQLKPLSLLLS